MGAEPAVVDERRLGEVCLGLEHQVVDNCVRWIVVERMADGVGEPTAGRYVAKEHARNCVARLLSGIMRGDDCGNVGMVDPVFDQYRPSRTVVTNSEMESCIVRITTSSLNDDDRVAVVVRDGIYQLLAVMFTDNAYESGAVVRARTKETHR